MWLDDEDEEVELEGEEMEMNIAMRNHNCSFAYVCPLESTEENIFLEKWQCLYCNQERTLRIYTGIRECIMKCVNRFNLDFWTSLK